MFLSCREAVGRLISLKTIIILNLCLGFRSLCKLIENFTTRADDSHAVPISTLFVVDR